ncbi:mycothiol synthase [Nakamurella sp. UYEF19]|uniref:GNAT family N-acetyltransferase n=1 Tax=Nakamurella sp. UYEF19 TaxID=1756392 RepID=UPI00339088CC
MTQLFMTHPGPLPAAAVPAPGLRPATSADASALARLLSVAFDEQWDEARVRRELLDAVDVPVTWMLPSSVEGEVSATASERIMPQEYPGAGYVHYVAVSAAEQGRGLGTMITARCLAGFTDRGLTTAVLETDDFRPGAVVSYLRLGFVPTYRDEAEMLSWSALFPTLLPSRRTVHG